MVMYAREPREPTYTVVIDGKTVGEVTRPVDQRVFGKEKGTVYLARPFKWRRHGRRRHQH